MEDLNSPHGEPAQRKNWLNQHRDAAQRDLQTWLRTERRWSWARLLTFLAAAAVWFPLAGRWGWAAAGCGTLLAGFIMTVRRHLAVRRDRQFAERRVLMCDEALLRCGGQLHVLRGGCRPVRHQAPAEPPHSRFASDHVWSLSPQEWDDLDFYSEPLSLFGLLNRTSGRLGAERLSDWLEHPVLDRADMLHRQTIVRWLCDHPEPRIAAQAACAVLRDHDDRTWALLRALREDHALPWSIALIRVLQVWAGLTAAATLPVLVWALMGQYLWGALFGVCAVVNLAIYARLRPALAAHIERWRPLRPIAVAFLDTASRSAEVLEAHQADSKLCDPLARLVRHDVLPALVARLGWTEAGGAIHTLFNVLYFYDLHVVAAVSRTAGNHCGDMLDGLAAVADLEALNSMASFSWEQPRTCWPEIVPQRAELRIEGGVHPLISADRVTPNGLALGGDCRLWIITGSNMAGKSTFLRMTGTNILLAQVGCAALAESMAWSPLRLVTDLRISDSVNKDESYFLAEVRQLRRMIVPEQHATPVFGLIDEPFRGTNSEERVAASVALVEHLRKSSNLFLVATHEHQLTDLADNGSAANYHFREDLEGGREVFDYTLRSGPATVRNALRVMEREGYPEAMMSTAQDWIQQHREA